MTAATPKHILAGDDSPEILSLLRDILEGEGYRVSLTAEALDLDQIKRTAPDLVIIDHMIEEGTGSGWELLRSIRRDPATAGLPVVVCTGAVHRIQQNQGVLERLGAEVVLKPFDIDRLLEAINHSWSRANGPGGCPDGGAGVGYGAFGPPPTAD